MQNIKVIQSIIGVNYPAVGERGGCVLVSDPTSFIFQEGGEGWNPLDRRLNEPKGPRVMAKRKFLLLLVIEPLVRHLSQFCTHTLQYRVTKHS
jgi:hypothetical protein